MASISLDREKGTRRILFIGPNGVRRAIYLGNSPERVAKTVHRHVEAIVWALKARSSLNDETAAWLAEISDELHAKLEAVRLVGPRRSATGAGAATLGRLVADFESSKLKAKPSTRIAWGHTWRNLKDRFGESRDIASITEAQAGTWQEWLEVEQKLSLPTIRKRCGNAKQLFQFAVRQRLIKSNPFAWLKSANATNRMRDFELKREAADRIVQACPDAEWRLLFALSRYGGLRCPSEHLSLRWDAIDWDKARMRVRSPKTEHHQGGASRLVPIFPELLPFLREVFEQAGPGAEYVITRYRDAGQNLRTQFQRIIKRAGLKPWPKLFHNLRATRQTELEDAFPTHVVCKWLGNSPRVAQANYLQVTESHFDRAAAHSTAQQTAERRGMGLQPSFEGRQKTLEFAANAANPGFFEDQGMGDAGLERPAKSPQKSRGRAIGSAPGSAQRGRRRAKELAGQRHIDQGGWPLERLLFDATDAVTRELKIRPAGISAAEVAGTLRMMYRASAKATRPCTLSFEEIATAVAGELGQPQPSASRIELVITWLADRGWIAVQDEGPGGGMYAIRWHQLREDVDGACPAAQAPTAVRRPLTAATFGAEP